MGALSRRLPDCGVVNVVRWGLVVPVKRLSLAKTRLQVLGDPLRQDLALAFATDVVLASLACPQVAKVLVVTDDTRARQVLGEAGAEVVADSPDAGHNAAIAHAATLLADDLGVAALSADLPSVTAADLSGALGQVQQGRGFVTDASGSGTTLLVAAPGAELRPSYGLRSRVEHLASGAVELAAHQRLRVDVDTPEDLAVALGLGVGERTAAVLRRLPSGNR